MSSRVVYYQNEKFQNSLIFLIFVLIANVSTSITTSWTEVLSKNLYSESNKFNQNAKQLHVFSGERSANKENVSLKI